MQDKKLMTARVIMTVLTATAIAAIFYNSSLDAETSTEQSSPLVMWINQFLCSFNCPFTITEKFIRKAAHFTEYSILGALLSVTFYLYVRKKSRVLMTALPAGALVAVCDELIQLFPAGRSCQVSDMVLDFCGVLFSTLIVLLIISLSEKRKARRKVVP